MSKKKEKPLDRIHKRFFRREEAAQALGLSERSIDAMLADKRLTRRRWGRCILIPAADIDRVERTINQSNMLQGVGCISIVQPTSLCVHAREEDSRGL